MCWASDVTGIEAGGARRLPVLELGDQGAENQLLEPEHPGQTPGRAQALHKVL